MEPTERLVDVVTQLVEPPLADMGYDLVRVRIGGGADMVVQIMAEPVSVWIAIPGFILFTALTLVIAALRIRRMEIAYGND